MATLGEKKFPESRWGPKAASELVSLLQPDSFLQFHRSKTKQTLSPESPCPCLAIAESLIPIDS